MAYAYNVSFEIRHDQMEQLQIGAGLEKVLGYLKTLLPSMPGFITAHAFYSLNLEEKTHLVVQSLWERWADLQAHQTSELAEKKVLSEFEPHVALENLTVHIYSEVP